MKKLIFLFVLALGVMSVTTKDTDNKVEEIPYLTCCTATITYEDDPVHEITRCTFGNGEAAETVACGRASQAARDWISSQGDSPD